MAKEMICSECEKETPKFFMGTAIDTGKIICFGCATKKHKEREVK